MTNELVVTKDRTTPELQASKWQQQQFLIDEEELYSLLEELGHFSLYRMGAILPFEKLGIDKTEFLRDYSNYIACLKATNISDLPLFKRKFTLVMSKEPDALQAFQLSDTEYMLKLLAPIIKIQAHSMHFSSEDSKFRPMVFGNDCISWGLQLSFPQIYLDSHTLEIKHALTEHQTENSLLFKQIQKWIRTHTVPTPFIVDGKKTNASIRLGKKCFEWIDQHPHLVQKEIKVGK